mgnify:CR=1 FL=1
MAEKSKKPQAKNASPTKSQKPQTYTYSESYTIVTKESVRLYNPSSVSVKKRIISA